MTAITITFRQALEVGACMNAYRKMARWAGGIKTFGVDTPISLATVYDQLGQADTLWALEAIGREDVLRRWAADCVEHALDQMPADEQEPLGREAIRVARLHSHGLADSLELRNVMWLLARTPGLDEDIYTACDDLLSVYLGPMVAGLVRENSTEVAVVAALLNAPEVTRETDRRRTIAHTITVEESWQEARLREYLRGDRR